LIRNLWKNNINITIMKYDRSWRPGFGATKDASNVVFFSSSAEFSQIFWRRLGNTWRDRRIRDLMMEHFWHFLLVFWAKFTSHAYILAWYNV
jgi:hypothetical protein